jgi:hypothetical protein
MLDISINVGPNLSCLNNVWGHFAQAQVSASALPDACRLYSTRRWMRWFSLGWFPFDNAARANNLMTKAIALFPEVEAWFVSKKLGPHLRFFGFRKAATPQKSSQN